MRPFGFNWSLDRCTVTRNGFTVHPLCSGTVLSTPFFSSTQRLSGSPPAPTCFGQVKPSPLTPKFCRTQALQVPPFTGARTSAPANSVFPRAFPTPTPPSKVDAASVGVLEPRRNLGSSSHHFRSRGARRRRLKSCPTPSPSPVYSSSGSNFVALVCISAPISYRYLCTC